MRLEGGFGKFFGFIPDRVSAPHNESRVEKEEVLIDKGKKGIQKASVPDRRQFLGWMAGAAAGLAIETSAEARRHRHKKHSKPEKYPQGVRHELVVRSEPPEQLRPEKLDNPVEQYVQIRGKIEAFCSKIPSRETLTPKERRDNRAQFMRNFGEELKTLLASPAVIRSLLAEVPNLDLWALTNALEAVDSHGLVYSFLAQNNRYSENLAVISKTTFSHQNDKFRVRAEDFLPEQVFDWEIEPTLASPMLKNEMRDKGWGRPEYQDAFRQVLAIPEARQLLQSVPGLPLSGAYSLIKAAIKLQQRFGGRVEDALKESIRQRSLFEKKIFLDPQTSFVSFVGRDYNVGTDKDRRDMTRHRQVAEAVGVSKMEQIYGGDEGNPGLQLLTALTADVGKTMVYVKTHGGKNVWGVSEKVEKNDQIIAQQIAEALLQRLVRAFSARQNPGEALAALKNVTIMTEACYGYDFLFKKLVPALKLAYEQGRIDYQPYGPLTPREILGIPFSQIRQNLPTVISSSQEDSSFLYYPASEDLSQLSGMGLLWKYREALRKEGRLTGEFLLQVIEPEAYIKGGDMTFSSTVQGRLVEISENESSTQENKMI